MSVPINIIIFQVVVLIFSAVIHEYMHGWMADRLGDTTAKDAGRLTMNPIVHLDVFGSLILPFLLVMTGSPFVFGWAKPVPFNPYNLKDQKYGIAKVAIAGPLGNLVTALFFGFVSRLLPIMPSVKIAIINAFFHGDYSSLLLSISGNQFGTVYLLLIIIVSINLLLMIFNLVPIPPLDGSKVLMSFLPAEARNSYMKLEKYGMILVMFFIIFAFDLIIPIINFLFRLIIGM